MIVKQKKAFKRTMEYLAEINKPGPGKKLYNIETYYGMKMLPVHAKDPNELKYILEEHYPHRKIDLKF